ncbi:hypothetical protein [Mycobacterium sp. C31M]
MNDAERIVLVKWSPALAAGALAVTALFWLVPLGYLVAGAYTGSDLLLRGAGCTTAGIATPSRHTAMPAPASKLRCAGIVHRCGWGRSYTTRA